MNRNLWSESDNLRLKHLSQKKERCGQCQGDKDKSGLWEHAGGNCPNMLEHCQKTFLNILPEGDKIDRKCYAMDQVLEIHLKISMISSQCILFGFTCSDSRSSFLIPFAQYIWEGGRGCRVWLFSRDITGNITLTNCRQSWLLRFFSADTFSISLFVNQSTISKP